MFMTHNPRRTKVVSGLAGVAALALLTACSAEEPTTNSTPADQESDQQTTDASPTAADATTPPATDDAAESATGHEQVFGIIEAVEAEYDNGFIVDVDADDDNATRYDVDVVVGNELYELEVNGDGTITVDEQEPDDDKRAKADTATVSVTEALTLAFDQHPEARFDQIELDEDDGVLSWDIDLEDADGTDIELTIPATS